MHIQVVKRRIARGELRRADLVLIADYAFPYVRVIEVKTRYEGF